MLKKRNLFKVLEAGVLILLSIVFMFLLIRENNFYYKGVFAEIQVMVIVLILIRFEKKGFWFSLTFLSIGALMSFVHILRTNSMESISGIIVNLGTIVICCIIFRYQKAINRKMRDEQSKSEELLALYEEISATEEELREQNETLHAYNQVIIDNKDKLNHLAYYDSLTSLPNRNMFLKKLEKIYQNAKRNGNVFFVVFIDLDNFKVINDTRGHDVGDLLLEKVAERLNAVVCKEDILGRLGGDEFSLIIQRDLTEEKMIQYVEKIRIALLDCFKILNLEIFISASFGISMFPRDGKSTTELLKYSDMAMYQVKKAGKNGVMQFERELESNIINELELECEMASALEKNEIYLVFQPQYTLNHKKLWAFEVLARWKSPKFGFVRPDTFIPLAEKNGFIVPMGQWIIRESCKFIKTISDTDRMDIKLSINISVVQIMDANFVNETRRIIEETGVNPSQIIFEVTESVGITSLDTAIKRLNKFKEMGIEIALDDFGTGYSSLNYLQMLPINILKIDKVFIDAVVTGQDEKHMVGPLIGLMHQMNLIVIAEGVEQEEQLSYLADYKCDIIQGYLWGKPLPVVEATKLINSQNIKEA